MIAIIRMRVMPLARMIGRLRIKIPYINQQKTPNENTIYMGSDTSRACPERYILTACGTNDIVVQIAPIIPIRFILSIGALLDFLAGRVHDVFQVGHHGRQYLAPVSLVTF